MFFYSDKSAASTHQVDVWKMDANKAYMRHFDNFLFLDFMLQNGTDIEKRESAIEMTICERKLKFWERHPKLEPTALKALKEKRLLDWRKGK